MFESMKDYVLSLSGCESVAARECPACAPGYWTWLGEAVYYAYYKREQQTDKE